VVVVVVNNECYNECYNESLFYSIYIHSYYLDGSLILLSKYIVDYDSDYDITLIYVLYY